jgi:hypothetical protein
VKLDIAVSLSRDSILPFIINSLTSNYQRNNSGKNSEISATEQRVISEKQRSNIRKSTSPWACGRDHHVLFLFSSVKGAPSPKV